MIAVIAATVAPSAAHAYTAASEGARLATSSWNADAHVIIAWPSSAGSLQVNAESDENGASSTWTVNFIGAPPAAPSIVSPCALASFTITCTVSAAEMAEGIEIWTGSGRDSVYVTDAGAAGDIAPSAVFPRGSTGDSQLISGGRGADLISTSEENAGTPSAVWMIGGAGKDTYVGSSNAHDIVSYGEAGRVGNVTAKLDCIPNDGNFTADGAYENVGCSSTSIEGLEGSVNDDYLVGDGASNQLYGLAGNDNIKGGDLTDSLSGGNGNDTLEGGTGSDFYWGDDGPGDSVNDGAIGDGDDTINAADAIIDHAIDCGGSSTDVANVDDAATDTDPITNCETVNRAGGGGTGGGTGGGANPGNPPSGLLSFVPVVDTTKTYVVDDLIGYTLDELALLFWLGDVNADFRGSKPVYALRKNLPKHPRGERWREGDVVSYITKRGTALTYSAGSPAKISLGYWAGPKKESCLAEAKNYKGFNVDEFKNTMADFGCKIDDVLPAFVNKVRGDDKCEVGKVLNGDSKRTVDAVVNIPRDPAKHDLFIGIGMFKAVKAQATNYRTDVIGGPLAPGWTLPTSNKTSFSGAVIGRTGNWVGNVTVYVDTSGVKGSNTTDSFHMTTSMSSDKPGQFTTPVFQLSKEGTVDVLALGMDKNGNAACGATQLKVKNFRRKAGTLLTNVWGRTYEYTPGESKPFRVRNDLAGKAAAARFGANTQRQAHSSAEVRIAANWWDSVTAWWNSLWSGKPNAQAAPAPANAGQEGRGLVQFAPGRALAASAQPAQVSTGSMVAAGGLNLTGSGGSGQMVAAGAGNMIFATTGMVAAGAGNMVAAGAGNLVAAGAGNIGGPVVDVSASSIRDVGGVKLIGMDGATMVAAGAGNMVAAGAGNMVAAGAGNLINPGSGTQ